jgi:hypothetical protein
MFAEYQTCVSILFVGYILGQIPSNMFLTRTRPSRYMVRISLTIETQELTYQGYHDDALGRRQCSHRSCKGL